jgi:hypothetical protein
LFFLRLMQDRRNAMPPISERSPTGQDEDAEMTMTTQSGEIDDMLDEALGDDSYISNYRSEGPTPPKTARMVSGHSPTSSAASWEFQTPQGTHKVLSFGINFCEQSPGIYFLLQQQHQKDFKTPRVEELIRSPQQGELPEVEGEEGSKLLHTVSFYRKQQTNVNVTPHQKIVRNAAAMIVEEPEKVIVLLLGYIDE